MAKTGVTGIRRIVNATRYSAQGLKQAIRYEAAFRQELALCLLLVPVGLWLGTTNLERIVLVASLLLVLIVELLNSAVEAVVDRIGDEPNDLSGRAKDYGSAAVFISLLIVLVIWGAIAWQRFAG